MPKETFYNLSEEKRKKVYDALLEEFSQYSYDSASINRIVKVAEISKGSIYQYFDDKIDMFKYLINAVFEKKIQYMTPVMLNPEGIDVFKLIREMYLTGIKFAQENPKLYLLAIRFMNDKEHPVYKEVMSENFGSADAIFGVFLKNAINRGEVKAEIDIEFVSHIISSLNVTLAEYFMEKNNSNNFDEMMELVDKLLDLIKNGIS